jgi:membrane protease YdiL (CAAX protease family)
MVTVGPAQISFALFSLLLGALTAATIVTWGWMLQQLVARRPILPEAELVVRRGTPWRVGTVLLVLLVYLLVSREFVLAYTKLTGRRLLEPPAARQDAAKRTRERHEAKDAVPPQPGEGPAPAPAPGPPVDGQLPALPAAAGAAREIEEPAAANAQPATQKPAASQIEAMTVVVVTDLVMIVLLPLLVRITSGASLRDFGVSLDGWRRQASLGIVASLAFAPLVYSVFLLATTIWKANAHPLQEMVLNELSPGVGELAILSGVIVAPIFEELLFRGILQNWLVTVCGRPRSVAPPIRAADSPPDSRSQAPSQDSLESDAPGGLAAPVPSNPFNGDATPARSGRLGIILTSLVFAAVHADQWPAPIGLFFLALVIGTVYQRTGSLITAIFMHATFNGLSTMFLFMAILAGQFVDSKQPTAPKGAPVPAGCQVPFAREWMHAPP